MFRISPEGGEPVDLQTALPIVVAVDDTGSANEAVEWAAAEAAARHLPLRVVSVLTVPLSVDPCATAAVIAQVLAARARASEVLERTAARAAAVASDLPVTTAVLDGPVTWALRREASAASMLVLSSRNRRPRLSRLARLGADSVSGALTTTAPCPVVVIRRRRQDRGAPTVVVGLELGPSGSAALRYAFAAAEQRCVPLVAVDSRDAAEIAEASTGAALLVLPSVGRRRILRSTPSIGRALLSQPGCPVVVVRTDAAVQGSGPYEKMAPWTASSGSD